MSPSDQHTVADVELDELESVDHYEATFTGTLDGEEVTLTYTLESAIGDRGEAVYAPGDEELENVLVRPDTYEFETDDQETVRFAGTDDDGNDLGLVYVFAEGEDADANEVALSVDPES